MKPLTILSSVQIDRLRKDIEGAIGSHSTADHVALPDAAELLRTPIQVAEPPKLEVDANDHTAADAENAVRIRKWLPDLTPTQAADPRLWTTLALREFWGYMQQRWPFASDATKLTRHFMKGGREDLNRQGIARLWWGAELTYAPWDRDPQLEIFRSADLARFTRVFFTQQQYAVDLMERRLGSSVVLRTCVLAALEALAPTVSNKDSLSRSLGKELNQLLQTQQLESRSAVEVRDTVMSVARAIAETLKTNPQSA